MVKKLRKEGYQVGRYLVRKIMHRLRLKATPRRAYKVTTQRKLSDAVADNLLNMNFNPVSANQVWTGDVTYLKMGEGWMYLAVVMDLYSRRIVGWHIDKRMTTDLISKALIKAYTCDNQREGWYFTVTEARNIPVSNSVGCYRAMVSEPAWVMWGRVRQLLLRCSTSCIHAVVG